MPDDSTDEDTKADDTPAAQPERQYPMWAYPITFGIGCNVDTLDLWGMDSIVIPAIVNVHASDLEGVFSYSLLTSDAEAPLDIGKITFMTATNSNNWFGSNGLNVLDAKILYSTDSYGNVGNQTQSVIDHYEYYIAENVFGSYKQRSLFKNLNWFEESTKQNIDDYFDGLNSAASTISQNGSTEIQDFNIAGLIFNSIKSSDISYWHNKQVSSTSGSGESEISTYNIPFMPDDVIILIVSLIPPAGQEMLTTKNNNLIQPVIYPIIVHVVENVLGSEIPKQPMKLESWMHKLRTEPNFLNKYKNHK
jgi:hypothetical protein